MYVESRKRWCKWCYLQSRNKDTDVAKNSMDSERGRVGGELGDGLAYTHYWHGV